MHFWLIGIGLALAALASLYFSTVTYSLRDFSRTKLASELARRKRQKWLDATVEHASDLVVITAVFRLLANILILIFALRLFYDTGWSLNLQYLLAVVVAGAISLFCSVAIPHALAKHAPENIIAASAPLIHWLRKALGPVAMMMNAIDDFVGKVAGVDESQASAQIEDQILSAVQEGADQGIVDPEEKEMIESVIQFRDTTASEIMTPRVEMVALDLNAKLTEVNKTIEESGHSRIPVYEDSLDHIVGILYARDLLHHLGRPAEVFEIRSAMRPPLFVPHSKPLRNLLHDFRVQKVHIAVVLDEYGGTAGLITIEDILEELVGEISDEHEPTEPPMLKKIDETTVDADARAPIEEVNQRLNIQIPEDAGYETLGGFIANAIGRIPPVGATFENNGVRYTVTEAEPHRINRVKIQLLKTPQSKAPAKV